MKGRKGLPGRCFTRQVIRLKRSETTRAPSEGCVRIASALLTARLKKKNRLGTTQDRHTRAIHAHAVRVLLAVLGGTTEKGCSSRGKCGGSQPCARNRSDRKHRTWHQVVLISPNEAGTAQRSASLHGTPVARTRGGGVVGSV